MHHLMESTAESGVATPLVLSNPMSHVNLNEVRYLRDLHQLHCFIIKKIIYIARL